MVLIWFTDCLHRYISNPGEPIMSLKTKVVVGALSLAVACGIAGGAHLWLANVLASAVWGS